VDQELRLSAVPESLEGQLLVQMYSDSDEDARLVGLFGKTAFRRPIGRSTCVDLERGPAHLQTIQWRSSTNLKHGVIRYRPRKDGVPLDWLAAHSKRARTERLFTPTLVNDP